MTTEPSPSEAAPDTRIPVTLLTGFLGSGKTTVLNHLLRQPTLAGAAVIVNEFGDVGLDHELVTEVSETTVLLQSGCLCCSIRGDLVDTLHEMLEQSLGGEIPVFDRVIVETTGLADPTPVYHTLMTDQVLASQFRLDGIIVTVDAAAGLRTLDTQDESVKQAAIADRILLTKSDLASKEDLKAIRARLKALNPSAPIIQVVNGEVAPETLLDITGFERASRGERVEAWLDSAAHEGGHRHDSEVQSACLVIDEPIPFAVLDLWLDALTARQGPDLLRMKGLINVEGAKGPLLVHGVQHVFHPPVELAAWPSEDHRTRIVLIARNIDAAALSANLDFLRSTARSGGTGPLKLAKERSTLLPGLGG